MAKPLLVALVILISNLETVPGFAQAEIGTPPPANPTVTTYRSGTSAKIPFEWVSGEIVVTATINGMPDLKLIVDTGCESSALDEDSIRGGHFPRDGSYPVHGIGHDMLRGKLSQNVRLVMEGLVMSPISLFIVSGQTFVVPMGIHIDGYLGYDILKNYVIKIDYINNTIEFRDSLPANTNLDQAIPITLAGGRIWVTAVIRNNGVASEPTPFIMDTGCSIGMVLFHPFLRANPHLRFPGGVERVMQGIGGSLIVQAVPCSELRFGNVALQDPYVQIMEQDPVGLDSLPGLIGTQIWKHFDMTIDFPGKRLFLKGNDSLDGSVRYVRP